MNPSLNFSNWDYEPSQDAYAYEEPLADIDEDDYDEITQEDCWTVISSFFDEKGLVRQQLDSFDEFVQNTMQELVDENSDLILHQAPQHTGHDEGLSRRYEIKFGQIYLSRPTVTEADGSVVPVFPQEARLRNLTYSAPLYIEMKKRVFISRDEGEGDEATWDEETPESTDEESTKVWIGKVSIALASSSSSRDDRVSLGPNHAAFNLLYPSKSRR
jgi:DNA-directed RNA polymerase II subunit RPB2